MVPPNSDFRNLRPSLYHARGKQYRYVHLFCAYDNTLVRYSAISVTIHVYRGFIKLIRTPKVVFFNEKKDALEILPG